MEILIGLSVLIAIVAIVLFINLKKCKREITRNVEDITSLKNENERLFNRNAVLSKFEGCEKRAEIIKKEASNEMPENNPIKIKGHATVEPIFATGTIAERMLRGAYPC